MSKFVFAYHGGSNPDTPEEQAEVMAAWNDWYGALGSAVLDGGAPVGAAQTVAADGSVSAGGGANPLTGFTLVEAGDLDAAVALAKGCPILAAGGSVEVGETIDMG
jgi:hypothetical protein